MNHLIYKITNTINGKIYIGAHSTLNIDDGYMGSGVNIAKSIAKHGKESFVKEILFIFDNKDDMYNKEAELVDQKFVERHDTYNAALGGKGNPYGGVMPTHIKEKLSASLKISMNNHDTKLKCRAAKLGHTQSKEQRLKKSIKMKEILKGRNLKRGPMSDAEKQKRSVALKGRRYVFYDVFINNIKYSSKDEAAKALNKTTKTISNWINDASKPDCYAIKKES